MSDYAYRVLAKLPTDTDWWVAVTTTRFYMTAGAARGAATQRRNQDAFYAGNSDRAVPEYKVQRVALGEWEDVE